MKEQVFIYCLIVIIFIISCNNIETPSEILQKTINTIDTIESIYFEQDMWRSNPGNIRDTIFRFREMYFKRLIPDSVVGVKGHWYMYINDKENVIYEDIYDGNRLIRKNNHDSVARIYDLVQYPEFRETHFWGHNTLYGMQYEFKFILSNMESYSVVRLNDTIVDDKQCTQIVIELKDIISMPGFATNLEDMQGSISRTCYFIDKKTNIPIRMKGVNYSVDNPEQLIFIDQRYHNIKFNLEINEYEQFNTSEESIEGFEKRELKPE